MIKNFLPRTLLARSLLIIAIPIVLIQAVTMIVFLDRHWGKMTARLSYALAGEIAWVADAIDDGADKKWLFERASKDFDIRASFTDGAKLIMLPKKPYRFWDDMVYDTLDEYLKSAIKRPVSLSVDLKKGLLRVNVEMKGGVLSLSAPTRRVFSSSSYIFLMWMAGSSILLLFIAVLFMRGQVRPIKRLAIAADRFGRGQSVPEFRPSGATEVRRAITAFFDMHGRITRNVQQRTQMLAGVSHDLGTIITRLKLNIAVLPDSADVRAMSSDVAQMENMLKGYLDFVRGAGEENAGRINMVDLIGGIAKRQNNGDITFNSSQDEISAIVRPMAITRCIENLIINALKYGDYAWIEVSQDGLGVKITVEDNGCGIDSEKRDDAFRPFVRLQKARTIGDEATAGTGLGLAIVSDIVHAHGGSVSINDSKHGGAMVVVSL